jgi:hypothetical protein
MMISGYIGNDCKQEFQPRVTKRRSSMDVTASFFSEKAVTLMDAFSSPSMPQDVFKSDRQDACR